MKHFFITMSILFFTSFLNAQSTWPSQYPGIENPNAYPVEEPEENPEEDSSESNDDAVSSYSAAEIEKIDNYVSKKEEIEHVLERIRIETQHLKSDDGLIPNSKVIARLSHKKESLMQELSLLQVQMNQMVRDRNAKNSKSLQADYTGDPVLMSTGQYYQEEDDFVITERTLVFPIKRIYRSQNIITGSLGEKWIFSLDTRIIRGVDNGIDESILFYKTNRKNDLENEIEKLLKEIDDYYNTKNQFQTVSEIVTFYKNLVEQKKLANSLYDDFYAHLYNATNTYGNGNFISFVYYLKTEILSSFAVLIEQYSYIKNVYQNLLSYKSDYDTITAELKALVPPENLLLAKETEITNIENQKNSVLFDGTPESFYKTGFNTLCFVDEEGCPSTFYRDRKNSFTRWIPLDPLSSFIQFIELKGDGSYFVKKENGNYAMYTKNGLLSSLHDSKGNTIYFEYTSEHHLSFIKTSSHKHYEIFYEGDFIVGIRELRSKREVLYEYEDKRLSSITDTSGDRVSIGYDDSGIIQFLEKPDKTRISYEFKSINQKGMALVSKTTNENGYSEYFNYHFNENNISHLEYIDYGGIKTYYEFDENHNTLKEYSPATKLEKTAVFSSKNKKIEETINGINKKMYYTKNGLLERVEWDDSSFEAFEWDEAGYITKYKDRDGAILLCKRDSKTHDILEIKKGSSLIYRGLEYDRGLPLKEFYNGVYYHNEYDQYGNHIKRSIFNEKEVFFEEWEWDDFDRIIRYSVSGKLLYTFTYGKTLFNDKIYVSITQKSFTGLEKQSLYDSRKNLCYSIETDTYTGERRVTKNTFDATHNLIKTSIGRFDSVQKEDASIEYCYKKSGGIEAILLKDKKNVWIYYRDKDNYCFLFSLSISEVQKDTDFSLWDREALKKRAENLGSCSSIDSLPPGFLFQKNEHTHTYTIRSSSDEVFEALYTPSGTLRAYQNSYGGWYTYSFDEESSQILSMYTALSPFSAPLQTLFSFEYDRYGRISSKTDKNGLKSQYFYNEKGLLEKEVHDSYTVFIEWDEFLRLISYSKDGIDTRIVYSDNNRHITVHHGDVWDEIYELNAWGEVIKKGDASLGCESFVYNANGTIIAKVDGYGRKENYTWNACGLISSIRKRDGRVFFYEYTHLGHIKAIFCGGTCIYYASYTENGFLKEEKRFFIDHGYDYDDNGRIIKEFEEGELVASYEYDSYGKQCTYKDARGSLYEYFYDSFGRLLSEKNREGEIKKYIYDDSDFLVGVELFSGKQNFFNNQDEKKDFVEYEYSNCGLLISQRNSFTGERISYFYDRAARLIVVKSPDREIYYEYGKNNEILSITDIKNNLSVFFSYDECMREIKRSYGNGISLYFLYDEMDRIVLIAEKNERKEILRLEAYVYNKKGRIVYICNEKGDTTHFLYDQKGRLSTVYYPSENTLIYREKEEAVLHGLGIKNVIVDAYRIDNESYKRLSQLVNRVSPFYSNRIHIMQNGWKTQFFYDENDNRIKKETCFGTIYYYYDRENRLLHSQSYEGNLSGKNDYSCSYEWDADGNLLSENNLFYEKEFSYNRLGRMVRCISFDKKSKKTKSVEYVYDALGRRVFEIIDASTMYQSFYVGKSFELFKKTIKQIGIKKDEFPFENGERYRILFSDYTKNKTNQNEVYPLYYNDSAIAFYSQEGRKAVYFGNDIKKSVCSISTANEYKRVYYDVFGNTSESSDVLFLFNGKEKDLVSDLYNFGFRDYSSKTARFTTIDPIKYGKNWFCLTNSDPVNFRDEWGLLPIIDSSICLTPTNRIIDTQYGNIKDKMVIEIQRSAGHTKGYFESDLSVYVKTHTGEKVSVFSNPVQSWADTASKDVSNEFTLPQGLYEGRLYDATASYFNPIVLVNEEFGVHAFDLFLLHAQEKTNLDPSDDAYRKWFFTGQSKGCGVFQGHGEIVLKLNTLLKNQGFIFGNTKEHLHYTDTIPIIIKDPPGILTTKDSREILVEKCVEAACQWRLKNK